MAKFLPKSWVPIRQSDDDTSSQEGLLPGDVAEVNKKTRKRWTNALALTAANVFLCLATISTVSLMIKSSPVPAQDKFVFPDLDLQTVLKPGNKSQWSSDEINSVFLKPPSPEVDAIWDQVSLENLEMTTITEAQARALGRDVGVMAKVPKDWDLGEDRYFAQVHVFHLLHCLDAMRKQMHYEHYYQPKFGRNPPEAFVNHMNHCLHMLLENLLCQSSSDIIVHNWRETYNVPLADFNPPRQCRNFDALREWGREHAIPDYRRKWAKLQVPSDAVVLPAPTPRLY